MTIDRVECELLDVVACAMACSSDNGLSCSRACLFIEVHDSGECSVGAYSSHENTSTQL